MFLTEYIESTVRVIVVHSLEFNYGAGFICLSNKNEHEERHEVAFIWLLYVMVKIFAVIRLTSYLLEMDWALATSNASKSIINAMEMKWIIYEIFMSPLVAYGVGVLVSV